MHSRLILGVVFSACAVFGYGCGTGTGAPSRAGTPTPATASEGGSFLYVTNQTAASVSVVDRTSMSVVAVVDLEALGFGANANPHHVAVEPDGSAWYVSLIGSNTVLKFDRTNTLVGRADFEVPGLLAIHPTEDWLFVGRSMGAVNPPSRIGRIQRSTMEVEEFDVFIPRPHGIAVSPDGGSVYTASLAENALAILDPSTGSAELVRVSDVAEQMTMVQLAVSPDGGTLVATGQLSGQLYVFSIGAAATPGRDAFGRRLTFDGAVSVGREPWHPAFTPDGREVWFGNLAADRITVVDASDWSVAAVITGDGISEPHGAAISADGRRAYVANRNTDGRYSAPGRDRSEPPPGTVVVIDTELREIIDVIETPPYAAGVGLASGILPEAVGQGSESVGGAVADPLPRSDSQQVLWTRRISPFEVTEGGASYDFPFLGGFDVPRPQLIDIDLDGDVDLFVQVETDKLLFFEAESASGGLHYAYRPELYGDLAIGEWFRFADVDGDGDPDLLAEQPFSYMRLYRNVGERGEPEFELVADTLRDTRGEPIFSDRQNIPNVADLDCDGRLDLLIGRLAGTITHYEATGSLASTASPFQRITDRFQNIEIVADPAVAPAPGDPGTSGGVLGGVSPVGSEPRGFDGLDRPTRVALRANAAVADDFGGRPTLHGANTMALVDVDTDGDVDLFWGDFFEAGLLFLENQGSCAVPDLAVEPESFPVGDPVRTSGYNAPTFGDLDADGDLDLLIGVLGGAYNPNTTLSDNLIAVTQDSTGRFSVQTRRFVSQIDVGSESLPRLVDLDSDGDLDLVVGHRIDSQDLETSSIEWFENTGTAVSPRLTSAGVLPVEGAYHNAPAFGDLDGDGDLDLVLGTWEPTIEYFENVGSPRTPAFVRAEVQLAQLTRGSNATPALADIDGDGDLDMFVGEASGTLNLYENTGGPTTPRFELDSDEYLDIDVGRRSVPVPIDADGDGDLDLVVGSESRGLVYYENRGDAEEPDFVLTQSPFPSATDLPSYAAPAFGDLDGDGRSELIVGGAGGGLVYFVPEP